MALRTRDRWIILAVALALTLAAARWAGSDDRESEVKPTARNGAEPVQRIDHDSPARRHAEPLPPLELDKLAARKQNAPAGDPFSARSWQALADEAARKNAPPPAPAPPPQAPPLPLAYMGKLVEDGRVTVFLTQRDDIFIVRKGETISGAYRVDEIEERSMSLTYLPLGQRQEFVFPAEK